MAKGRLRWMCEGYGERGAVDFMCSPGVAGRRGVLLISWEWVRLLICVSLCDTPLTAVWLVWPHSTYCHQTFSVPHSMKRLQTFCWWCTCTEKNNYSEIIIILISQACNLFLCRLGLAISSGCALEEWHMAICAWGLVTEHFIHAKCTLPTYIFFFLKKLTLLFSKNALHWSKVTVNINVINYVLLNFDI